MLSAYTFNTIPQSFAKQLIDVSRDKYGIPLEIMNLIFQYLDGADISLWDNVAQRHSVLSINNKLSAQHNGGYIGHLLCDRDYYLWLRTTGSYMYLKWDRISNVFKELNQKEILSRYLGQNWNKEGEDGCIEEYIPRRRMEELKEYSDGATLYGCEDVLTEAMVIDHLLSQVPQTMLYKMASDIDKVMNEYVKYDTCWIKEGLYKSKTPRKSWKKSKLIGYIWKYNCYKEWGV